jgi:amidase
MKERFEATANVTPSQIETMQIVRNQVREKMDSLLGEGKVLIWPTTPGPAPHLNTPSENVETFRFRTLSLTCPAGLAGLPQINLPLSETEGAPLGISIIGARGSDMMLLKLAKTILKNLP